MSGKNQEHPKGQKNFLGLELKKWQNLILLTIILFNALQLGFTWSSGHIFQGYGVDFLAFWSAGKLANQKGYAAVYELADLKAVQIEELGKADLSVQINPENFKPLPAALFPIFLFPFALISKLDITESYWIWTIFNLITLFSYLIFFTNEVFPLKFRRSKPRLILIMLLSYPILATLLEGQVEIFLILFAGEFIRNALKNRPYLAGVWLGGLLLKPQLLILVIPVLIFWQDWKTLSGFLATSTAVGVSTFLLAGASGIKGLLALWTEFGGGIATSSPGMMINWRMLGINLNSLLASSAGWWLMTVGMVLTILATFRLLSRKPTLGSPQWVFTMLAIFSATLAVTWHSHYHMATVLIPFLLDASSQDLLPDKLVFSWAVVTPLILIGMMIVDLVAAISQKTSPTWLIYLVPLSGFALNSILFAGVSRKTQKSQEGFPSADGKIALGSPEEAE